ncbi:MAG TPA: GGDEF domain-containing protein [Steroidobacteraceae bacterium]|nr:GGDEF domain-containing protein [Steroidobacteraceae bacterium]
MVARGVKWRLTSRAGRLDAHNRALRGRIKRALGSVRALRAANKRLQIIAGRVPALIGYWNRELRCEFANEAYREWYGLDPDRIVGMRMPELLGEQIFALNEPYARAALEGREQRFERTLTKADGSEVQVDARYMPDIDEHGQVTGFVVLVTDITALRQAQQALEAANAQLRSDSLTDYLTGLYNRRVFSQQSERAFAELKRLGKPYGLILLDLDDFKRINDEFGHAAGDEALRVVGRVLRDSLHGQADIPARLGGEEFAVLCFGDLSETSLHGIAERIRAGISAETLQAAARPFKLTASFGIALGSPADSDWKSVYARADSGLYEAKVSGKNRVAFGDSTRATGRLRALGLAD